LVLGLAWLLVCTLLVAAWLVAAWLVAAWLVAAWLVAAWLVAAWRVAAWLVAAWLVAAWLVAAWLMVPGLAGLQVWLFWKGGPSLHLPRQQLHAGHGHFPCEVLGGQVLALVQGLVTRFAWLPVSGHAGLLDWVV
jgi:hypothetical protein